MFTQQTKIQYLHFKQYPDDKISSKKELTPRAAKRHETQKMIDTVKTAMAFISAPCPAVQQHRAGKTTEFWDKNQREEANRKLGGGWRQKGRLGSLGKNNNVEGRRAKRKATCAILGIRSSFQVPPISSAYQSPSTTTELFMKYQDLFRIKVKSALTKVFRGY